MYLLFFHLDTLNINEMRRNNTVIMKDQERTKTGLNIMENRLTKFK